MATIHNGKASKHITLFVVIAFFLFLSVGTPCAFGAYIQDIKLNREPHIVSMNSFWSNRLLDGTYSLKVTGVYVTAQIVNDSSQQFSGFLKFREGGGSELVSLGPYETKAQVIKVPRNPVTSPGIYNFTLDLKTGFWLWEQQILDTYNIVIDVRDSSSPTFDGPKLLGKNLYLNTVLENSPYEFFETIKLIQQLFCGLVDLALATIPEVVPCLEEAMNFYNIEGQLKEHIKRTAQIFITTNSLNENNVRHLYIKGGNCSHDIRFPAINYDRGVLIITLPSDVNLLTATPNYDLHYSDSILSTYVWIYNNVDKLLEGGGGYQCTEVGVDLYLQEPYDHMYTANTAFLLQFGPFANLDDFSHHEDPPQYDYFKWSSEPENTYWLTVSSAIREETFSSSSFDNGRPFYISAPYANLSPDTHSTSINLNDFISYYDLSRISFTTIQQSNVDIAIEQNTNVATVTIPPGWTGREDIIFRATDENERSTDISGYITSILSDVLISGQVTPASGTKDDLYTFSVIYRNPDNTYPKRALVIVNGIPHNMRKQSGSPAVKDGAIFEYAGKPSTSTNQFYFEFGDDQIRYRHPEDDVIYGPDIAELHDIAIRNFNIYPEVPQANDTVEVKAQIENLGTQLEPTIPVAFKVNGVVRDSRSIAVSVERVSPVIEFSYQIPVSDYEEDYELRIEGGPVTGETNTADNSDFVNLAIIPKPGAISGWVFDQYNNPLENATIRVIDSTTEDYGSTKSNYDGYYYLDGLKPTPDPQDYYTLEASIEGEGSAILTNVEVYTQQTTENKIFNLYPTGMTQLASGRYLCDTACSPNGDKIAFVQTIEDIEGDRNYRALYRVNENGSDLTRMTGPDKPAYDVSAFGVPKFSPDGTKIVFEGSSTIQTPQLDRAIWITSANGDGSDAYELISATNDFFGRYPTWSPNGQKIAYIKVFADTNPWTYKLSIYDIASHTESYLKDGSYGNLDWSPDGNWIACSGTYLINAATGAEVPISTSFETPCWLPDSSGIIYHSSWNIWLYYIDTEEKVQLTFDPEIERYPSVPRNVADKIAFTSNKGFPELGDYGLFTMPFSPPSLYFQEVTAQPDTFTPNGDGVNDNLNISYSINSQAYVTLKIHDSQGNYIRTLVDNEIQDANTYNISWDGKSQYGLSQNAEVYFYRFDMHDDNETAISAHGRISMIKDINSIGSNSWYPRWSHQGDKIVYVDVTNADAWQIYICDANDFTNKQLVPTPFNVARNSAWSRNDDQIVFASYSTYGSNRAQIAKINIDGTGYTELTTETLGSLLCGYYPAWSPTEDTIIFNGWWNEPPEGNFLHISKMNSDGTSLEKIEEYLNISDTSGPAWSPDGNKITWATEKSGSNNIWTMNSDGSTKEQFTFNPYRDSYPEFTPDGKRLLFGSQRHTGSQGIMDLWTKSFDDSHDLRCLYKETALGVPSPDGSRILLSGGQVIDLFVSLTKGTIEGRVLNLEDLSPIEGATMSLEQNSVGLMQALTNEQGGYQFCNLEPGEYTINAEAQDYLKSDDIIVQTHSWVFSRDNDIKLQHLPVVNISEISEGEKIGSVIPLNTKIEDGDVVYVRHQYKKDGEEWHDIETTVYPYPARFDTVEPNLPSGSYQLKAVAVDALGNTDSSPNTIAIEIDHTPSAATILRPINGTTFNGTINITASSLEPDTDSVVFQYRKKGDVLWINIGSVDIEEPWVREWKTDHLEDGEYELRAIAIDSLGNIDENPEMIMVTIKLNPSDFDDSGCVDSNDLNDLAISWLSNEPSVDVAPRGGDGTINFFDFAEFAKHWLEGCMP